MPRSVEEYHEHDAQIWEEELAGFVPPRVFDAHVHLLDRRHLSPATPAAFHDWSDAGLETLRAWAARLYPGRQVHFLALGTPAPGIDVEAHNRFLRDEIKRDGASRFNRLVTPACLPGDIERDVAEPGCIGLKPYRLFSTTGDAAQCRIADFLPHRQLEVADQFGLWVTMHLSRYHACADRENLDDLEEFTTRRYPRIKWILAHCGRSFTYWPIRQAVRRLRDLPNISYDTSAVTDVRPLATLFSQEDTRRILYGSDGVDAAYFHGKYVTLGRAWQTLDADRTKLEYPHCDGRPVLAVYEQLLAMKHASEYAGLSSAQIEDIFWRNAAREFEIDWDAEVAGESNR